MGRKRQKEVLKFDTFLDQNQKILTVFGIFVGLSSYLLNLLGVNQKTEINNYLILASLFIALLIGVYIVIKYLFDEKIDAFVSMFIWLFLILQYLLFRYVANVYAENMLSIYLLASLFVGVLIPYVLWKKSALFFKNKLKIMRYSILGIIVSILWFKATPLPEKYIDLIGTFLSAYLPISIGYAKSFLVGVLIGSMIFPFAISLISASNIIKYSEMVLISAYKDFLKYVKSSLIPHLKENLKKLRHFNKKVPSVK